MRNTQSITDVMAPDPICMPASSSVASAAIVMRDAGIGDVVVEDEGRVCGIVTDRDITIRVVAEDRHPSEVSLGEICSRELTTLSPWDSVADAVRLMRDKALRRLPVVDDGRPVGIVTLGDLALDREPGSALALISSAPPNL